MVCKKCGYEYSDGASFCPQCGTTNKKSGKKTVSVPRSETSQRVIFALSYVWLFFFLPLIFMRKSEKGLMHANQSLCLTIAEFALFLVAGFLRINPLFYLTGALLSAIVTAASVLVRLYLGVNAFKGVNVRLPIIGYISLIH